MLSTLLELLGFSALTVATFVAFGLAPGLFAGGVSLLVVAQGVEGLRPFATLREMLRARRATKA